MKYYQVVWCYLLLHNSTMRYLSMLLMLLELASRVPRKAKEIEDDDEEPSTFRKVLYSYLALTLLHAEFSAVLYRINGTKREQHSVQRRLMIARKFKRNNSPSIFVSANEVHPRRFLGNCRGSYISERYSADGGIADVPQILYGSSGTTTLKNANGDDGIEDIFAIVDGNVECYFQ